MWLYFLNDRSQEQVWRVSKTFKKRSPLRNQRAV